MLQDATTIMRQSEMEHKKNDRIYAVRCQAISEEYAIKLKFLKDQKFAQLALCETEQEAREVEERFTDCATAVMDTLKEALKQAEKSYMTERIAINQKAPKYD